jgi:hypothetical protein
MARNGPPVVVAMAPLGIRTRAQVGAQLAAAALLLLITVAPWREAKPRVVSGYEPACTMSIPERRADVLLPPLSIDIPDRPAATPNSFNSWGHPDMRPWPSGMVMGMGTVTTDPMVMGQRSFVDSLLSALADAVRGVSS